MLKTGTFLSRKYRAIFAAALIGWLINIAGEMADSILAGIFVNETAVAAVELVSPLSSIIYGIGVPLAACGIVFSRFSGAFEKENSYKAAFTGVVGSIITGIIMFIVLFFLKDTYLGFYNVSPEMLEMAGEYYMVYLGIALIEPLTWTIYNLVSIDGDDGLTLGIDILMASSNVAFSLILAQFMGIRGLALGTLLSYALSLLLALTHFLKKSNSVHFIKAFDFKIFAMILTTGLSSALVSIYIAVVDLVMNKTIITFLGENYLAAYAVINVLIEMSQVMCCAFDGGRPFITVGYGEKNNYLIKNTMKKVTKYVIVLSLVLTFAFELLAPFWASLYEITDPTVIQAATFCAHLLPITYIFYGFVYNYQSYYNCVKEIFISNFIGAIDMLIAPLLLAVPTLHLWGFKGMTIGFMLAPVLTMVIGIIPVLIRKVTAKRGAFPLIQRPSDETVVSYDLVLTKENISGLTVTMKEYLSDASVSPLISNKVQLLVEETLSEIMAHNPDKKTIAEISILYNEKAVRVITRDNGVIFDITESDNDIKSLRCYVLAQLMQDADKAAYYTTISFNRNMYLWERDETLPEPVLSS